VREAKLTAFGLLFTLLRGRGRSGPPPPPPRASDHTGVRKAVRCTCNRSCTRTRHDECSIEVVVGRERHEQRVLVGHDHLLQPPQTVLLQSRHNVRLLLGDRSRKPTCAILITNHVSGLVCVRIFGLFMAAAFFLQLCASVFFLILCASTVFLVLCASTIFFCLCA